MAKVQVVHKDALPTASASPGIVRNLAFNGDGCVVLRSRADPGAASGWHNHGDYNVYGYVVSGSGRIESGPGGRISVSLASGDFLSVPPHTVHRETNASSTEPLEVILFLRGTGSTVFNEEGPEPD
jgi:uncharacterized RmlC-like cupin family protein